MPPSGQAGLNCRDFLSLAANLAVGMPLGADREVQIHLRPLSPSAEHGGGERQPYDRRDASPARLGQLMPAQMNCFIVPRPPEELYDIVADPHKMTNIVAEANFAHRFGNRGRCSPSGGATRRISSARRAQRTSSTVIPASLCPVPRWALSQNPSVRKIYRGRQTINLWCCEAASASLPVPSHHESPTLS